MTSGGLVLGYVADAALGDPRRGHPVAGFGRLAGALERRTYADRRAPGVLHVALLVGGAAVLGRVAGRGTLVTAAATWAVLGGRSLDREAAAVQALLEAGRLPDARQRLTHLVGRDTAELDEAGVARAVVESLAENSSDAVVAPLVWGALAGTPGLLAYRAANTLDAMVGHRSPRYERFGWAAARLDDLLNLPGSRLTAALTVLLGDDHDGALRAWRRDAGAHPSPNAGPVEAAFAGALGVRLGGRTVYAGRVEERPVLGDGREVGVHDVTRARRLARRVDLAALLVCAAASAASAALRRRR
ncbi:cobalamin biosynthesis protein [Nocardioides lijunqiniae]|uniref:cobalamin biosynthesis protein n=1 Tax=Nocardioides lijunqiniae TaxID=2760832 RepID=UPI001878EAF7|nr:cobalamin biosynthesis protein [Nocardioides lijunqiniae]